MQQLFRRLRARVPERVVGAFANCGGTNLRTERFAGNLARGPVDDETFLGILHSLIFPNGVRKTTQLARNLSIVERLIASPAFPAHRPLAVLDVGAAAGLDALTTRARLLEHASVGRYVLGDLHTHLLYDERRGLVFDEDHTLLQVRRPGHFVALNFHYNYAFQRYLTAPKQVRPWLLRNRYRFDPHAEVTRIPLVHRDVVVDGPDAPFALRRMNVFEPIPGSAGTSTTPGEFDLVFCLHLLVPRYFSPETIARGERNLRHALADGGLLVVGALEDFRVIVRRGAEFEAVAV